MSETLIAYLGGLANGAVLAVLIALFGRLFARVQARELGGYDGERLSPRG
jgi:hypothetical protein